MAYNYNVKVVLFCVVLWLTPPHQIEAVPPSAIGDVILNTGSSINQVTVSEVWKLFSSHVREHDALKLTLRSLRVLPARAAHVAQHLVDRLRVGEAVPVVKYTQGSVRGRIVATKTRPSKIYYSFKGIRYAQPPTGMFRFRAPRPVEPWKGVKDALEEGNVCPHRFILFDNYKGEEDCLFLNVYSPSVPAKGGDNPKYPVMVWLHGGGFAMGSGNAFFYGPDYLVAEDVLLVTLNYRLGTLGFLSLENDDVPGNAGLKDQVMALKWVQENIEYFGGDPSSVTIFGESAGAAAVQYLMLTPMAKGLFHRAISQSGWTTCPWALAESPRERAFALGRVLGMYTNNTDQLIGFLRAVPSERLVMATQKILTVEDSRRNIGIPFVPSVEPGTARGLDEAFLTEHPVKLLEQGNFTKVPYLTGFNSHEGLLFVRRLRKDPSLLIQVEKDFSRMVPPDLMIPGGRDSLAGQNIADRIRQFYLGGRRVTMQTTPEMILLLTDIMFLRPLATAVRLQKMASPESPIYLYRFAFDGALGLFKRFLGINRPGTCHGDEMGYLFKCGALNIRLDEGSNEVYVKKRMVKMWTNFAKYGNPTPNKTVDIDYLWEPVNDLVNLEFLNITGNFTPGSSPESGRMAFWDQLYEELNGENWKNVKKSDKN